MTYRANNYSQTSWQSLWLLAVCLLPVIAQSEPSMVFRELGLDDGLSQSTVMDTYQDSRGFVWIATESGLNRFDGYDVVVYGREPGNPNALSHDYIWAIDEDKNGDIWLATDGGGVAVWRRQTGSFQSYRHSAGDAASLSSDVVRNLLVARDGTVWVATRDAGLNRISPASETTQRIELPAEIAEQSPAMYALMEDRDGDIWIGTNIGILRRDAESGTIHHFPLAPSLQGKNVLALTEDSRGKIWAGTFEGGLARFNPASNDVTIYRNVSSDPGSLSNDDVRAVFEDNEARLWVGTADGLNLLDRSSGQFTRYSSDSSNRYTLSDDYIMSIAQDRSGLLWIGTRSGGVNRWNPRSWRFGHQSPDWLDGAYVTSFADDAAGNTWIGTIGAGLNRIDRHGQNVPLESLLDGDQALPDPRVMSLLADTGGNLWIGMMTGGLARLSADNSLTVFRHDVDNEQSLSADGVMSLFEDRLGRIWIGTFGGGVNHYDPETGEIYRHPDTARTEASDSGIRATSVAEDRNGNLWIGTDGAGLILMNPLGGVISRYRHDPESNTSLAANTIYSIMVDRRNTVWLGMAGGGLGRVHGSSTTPADIRFEHFGRSHTINEVVYGVQADSSGDLWLSTNRGLTKFDPDTEQAQSFFKSHGMQDEEFNFGAHHKATDGRLLFGGPRGYNEFFPNLIDAANYSLPVVLTQLEILNEPLFAAGVVPEVQTVTLDHDADVVTFGFSAVDYVDPEKIRYAYRLKGFNDEFVDANGMRRATYTNLDAGKYLFEVKASNAQGIWNEPSLQVPITVEAAPWQSAWAYALYASLIAGALYWLVRHKDGRIRREEGLARELACQVEERTEELNRRNVDLQEASEAKSTFLARMSHEIRTPMNGVIGMTEMLRGTDLTARQKDYTTTISTSAESLLQIINDILDLSKIESGQFLLDDREFNLLDLVDETTAIVAGGASKKDIDLLSFVEPDVPECLIGDAYRLRQILTNLIANAVKFTDVGEVMLAARRVGDDAQSCRMRFEVIDTGIGIPADKLEHVFQPFSQADESTTQRFGGTGLGLSICRNLVKFMDGEIGVNSTPGIGTTFWCEVPFEAVPTTTPVSRAKLRGRKVLVATTARTLSHAICAHVSYHGGVVATVNSTSELSAIAHSDNLDFDSAILDADSLDNRRTMALANRLESHGISTILLGRDAAGLEERIKERSAEATVIRKPIAWRHLLEKLQDGTNSGASPKQQELDDDGRRRPRVLVVDSGEANRLVAQGMFSEIGCDVTLASNSKTGIAKATTEQFDLIVMDIHLSETDGFETTMLIRAWESSGVRTPIVAVADCPEEDIAKQRDEAGIDDFVAKPYKLEALQRVLDRWVAVSRATDSVKLDCKSLDGIRDLQSTHSPDILSRALQVYLTSSAQLLATLDEGRRNDCIRTMCDSAHALKSSSANIGALQFAELAASIETACRDNDVELAVRLSEKVAKELDAVHTAVNDELFREAG